MLSIETSRIIKVNKATSKLYIININSITNSKNNTISKVILDASKNNKNSPIVIYIIQQYIVLKKKFIYKAIYKYIYKLINLVYDFKS